MAMRCVDRPCSGAPGLGRRMPGESLEPAHQPGWCQDHVEVRPQNGTPEVWLQIFHAVNGLGDKVSSLVKIRAARTEKSVTLTRAPGRTGCVAVVRLRERATCTADGNIWAGRNTF